MRLLASTLAIGTIAMALPLMAAAPKAQAAAPMGAPVIQADWDGYHHDWHHHWRHEYRGDWDRHWHHHWHRPPPPPYGYYAPPPPPGTVYGYVYRY